MSRKNLDQLGFEPKTFWSVLHHLIYWCQVEEEHFIHIVYYLGQAKSAVCLSW